MDGFFEFRIARIVGFDTEHPLGKGKSSRGFSKHQMRKSIQRLPAPWAFPSISR
jgi:hypothetical protein